MSDKVSIDWLLSLSAQAASIEERVDMMIVLSSIVSKKEHEQERRAILDWAVEQTILKEGEDV